MTDFALEMASQTTAGNDVGGKRELYERLGIGEYWRFDATGGDLYGEPLVGERLVDGHYQRIPLTHEPDGSIRGYSPALDIYLSWERQQDSQENAREDTEDGWLFLYNPATGRRLLSYSEVRARAEAESNRAEAAEAEVRQLREQLRRLRGD